MHSSPMASSSRFPTSRRFSASRISRNCRCKIRYAVGDRELAVEIHSVQSWAMTAQIASHYRKGRTFVIGDAAHRFPPTGGLGLNTGVHDAHNLAWKLAWEISGRAPIGLLDPYDTAR